MNIFNLSRIAIAGFAIISVSCCSRNAEENKKPDPPVPPVVKNEVDVWITKGDESVKLQKQTTPVAFTVSTNVYQNIDIDVSQTYQTVDGFGYTLTGGSAEVINTLSASKKQELLQDLFGSGENSIAVSYLRISIGASDLNSSVFSYNDLEPGQTDINLTKFSLEKDRGVINLLKEILAINPKIKILGSPWSAPVWMKTNGSTIGGSLKPEYYGVYAQYFVKYIQAMKNEGITVDAITIQNEPLHGGNNPSMVMTAEEQATFVKQSLGPAFKNAGINTKIIVYDHNCDRPDYPIAVLSDKDASPYIDGAAFHLYGGDISALSSVRNTFPTKNVYFTEQWTASNGNFGGDLKWHTKNVVIGSMRNWSKNALEWNLANDPQFKPYTSGGCTMCKGAITVNSTENYAKNVSYYIIAHASKFVPQNSVRIASTQPGNLATVAFKREDGKLVLIVENDGNNAESFNIRINGKIATLSLEAGAVGTYIF
jgi:glucosylceramidase